MCDDSWETSFAVLAGLSSYFAERAAFFAFNSEFEYGKTMIRLNDLYHKIKK
jgi:hypothetical protein